MGLRRRSIRLRILLLVVIPILSLIAVYAFAAGTSVSNAVNLSHSRSVYNTISLPSGLLEAALDAERIYAVVYLADPAPPNLATLQTQESKTNQSVAAFDAAARASAGSESAATRQAFATMSDELARLPALRSQVTARTISRPQVISAYGSMLSQDGILEDQIILQGADVHIAATSLAINRTGNVVSLLLQEEALLLGDSLARSDSAADRQQFAELVGGRQAMYAEILSEFDPTIRAIYARYLSPRVLQPLETLENEVITQPRTGQVPPVSPIAFSVAVQAVSQAYESAGEHAAAEVTAQAQPEANSTFLRLYLVAGLGLLAIIVSIAISVLIGRGLARQLAELRRSALDLAGRRLPGVVERLRSGQDVDVAAEAPPLAASGDEIGQVMEAFNAVQRTAVEVAVDEARLRRGISDVFRNLARRSQSLLHRQLALLDAMERRASEPEELESLFRIDHLTTRMRRHSEGLIILSGDSPARGWRHPVAFVDVLRAAAAEVEDYTRIRVTTGGTRAALASPAVADVIHLLAELAENATIYSPPTAPVRIRGDVVGRGYAIEIEDRGLGMSEERLAEVNRDFAHPPQFDLSGSEQLGLFVAGQLARRHDIKITLQVSAFGGITAVVLIPKTLVVEADGYGVQVATAAERATQLTGRRGALSRGPLADPPVLAGALTQVPASEPPPGLPADPTAGRYAQDSAELPAAQAAEPESLFTPPRRREPDATPGLAGGSDAADARVSSTELFVMGLPVRVRQASLAPQLRDASPVAADAADEVASAPSPEAARSTMTALQRGWERGRYISAVPEPSSGTAPGSQPGENGGEQPDEG